MTAQKPTHTRTLPPLQLRVGELTIAVPPTLNAITTYVLLEQEDWFEKEVRFLRRFIKSGMTAIDVGANLGVYSLLLAQLAGPRGRVFAYEPGAEARALLEQSRVLNNLGHIEIIDRALSDGERDSRLKFAASSELRALGNGDAGEPVRITSLDAEGSARGWPSIDFIKIDAEGEEERILVGGTNFFAVQSPLVMIEIKAVDRVNEGLCKLLPAIGYRLFRQIEGAAVLVPQEATQPLDPYELNLFAAKPDRAKALAHQGLLVEALLPWAPSDEDRRRALALWRRQKFATVKFPPHGTGVPGDAEYLNGLAAYAVWRSADRPIAQRCAALVSALQSLRAVCARAPTAERESTWARVAWESGARRECVAALMQLMKRLQGAPLRLTEAFWPASPRFDRIAPGTRHSNWFIAAAAEQHERTAAHSSRFNGGTESLGWLCGQPFASMEMERRRVLLEACAGLHPVVPKRLCLIAPDHRNAEVWRTGLVPGTTLAA